jgi:DNA repair protein RadC
VSDLANHTLQYSGGESADKNFAVILDEKNKEIDRQSNIIKTLQQKLATVQKERDVLKTALKNLYLKAMLTTKPRR